MLASAYLPGLRFVGADQLDQSQESCLQVSFIPSQKPRLRRLAQRVELYDRWQGQGSLLDLLHLSYSVCRLRWLEMGLYCVHSACVGKDSHTLLVGHSGSGKTTTALKMAESAGLQIFSGNKTLLAVGADGIRAVAGTRTMTRTAAAEKASQVQAVDQSPACLAVGYQERLAYSLDEGAYSSAQSVPVSAIALIRLNDGVQEETALESLSAMHKLFPFFLDMVNADTVLGAGAVVFSGSAGKRGDAGQKQVLSRALAAALKAVPVYSLSGSLDFVADRLESLQVQQVKEVSCRI